ncbi:MAG: S8 family serine peptidase [bacterium]|nr:S8 family serine peptidase [bacterium]
MTNARRVSLGLVAGLLLAASLSTQATAAEIALPDGKVIHKTDNWVIGQRVLPVAGTYKIHRWDEELPSGEVRSFYAYSRMTKDGSELVGRVRAANHMVRLLDFQFDPLVDGPPSFDVPLKAGRNNLHLVQLEATPLPEMTQAIADTGARILRFLADHTFLVKADAETLERLHSLAFVRWVGPYDPLYRVERVLREALDGHTPPLGRQRYSLMVGERGAASQQALAAQIGDLGGIVELVEPGGWRVEATLSHGQLKQIIEVDEVQFVDRWGGPGELDMDVVRTVGGGDYVESVGNFTGQGVRGEIFDTELRTTHQEWNHTPLIHSVSTSCSSLHGTSCYSNNFAQGVDPAARGMIPNGQGIFFCYSESTQFGGSTSRYDANAELIDPAGPYRAVFQTSSVGSARTFFYTTISAETDDYLFEHQLLSTQSQSNAGNQDSRPQSWAKNIVGVGGIRHLNTVTRCDDYHGSSGSTGPAEDGRIKPDLSYFYDSIQSASGGGDTSYTGFGGTSSATPQTSGHFGLLFQMWHEGVWAGHGGGIDVFDSRPQMATAKALMINHAWRYDWTAPGGCSYGDANRFRQGWGTANVQHLYDRASVTNLIDETDVIAPLETKTYTATVEAGESELNVTMVYTDPAGTVGAQVNRINDLSLRVTSPSSTVYWGNNGLTASNWSTSGGSSNTVDTVENVFIQNPQAGSWTIEVLGDEIVQDAHLETGAVDADFALVVSGGLFGSVSCTGDPDCDDGLWCNGAETCNLGTGQCEAGTPPLVCDDSVACTTDSCNEGTQACDYVPNDAYCDNGLYCDGAETCDAVLGCQAGASVNCADGVGCTDDSCNEGTDQCDNLPNDGLCDNGLFCDGAETCDVLLDCQAGTDPCFPDPCDEVNDLCETTCGQRKDPCATDDDCCAGLTCHHKKFWCK